jgi:hypothetical protein
MHLPGRLSPKTGCAGGQLQTSSQGEETPISELPLPPYLLEAFWLINPNPPVGFRLSVGTAAVPYVWTEEPLPPPPPRLRLFF